MAEPNEIHYKQHAQVKSNSLNVVKLVLLWYYEIRVDRVQ